MNSSLTVLSGVMAPERGGTPFRQIFLSRAEFVVHFALNRALLVIAIISKLSAKRVANL